ncbi:MAG TPA: type II toxin-antitoxin system RelE/ParE family toxin [Thermoanaerobaculia bacterium]
MPREVIISTRAKLEIIDAELWWFENREKAPNAFREELEAALTLLTERPEIGTVIRTRQRSPRTHRLTLRRVNYYLYYRVEQDSIIVTSLWHTSRRPPRL